jgi:CheY-like chemotaxis protein
LPTKQRDIIGIVKRNGEHLADLIEGLLEISKIEAGRVTLHRDEFNLKIILQQIVDMFQMIARQKGIAFHYLPSANIPDIVACDKQRFRQILINLVSNAIKYTEKGSVTLQVSYRNQVATFSIIDTGIGIAPEDQEAIFKPFEQIRNSHTQAIGGTGLGLTISRSLTELMGGEITLKSTAGQGSTFNLRLMLVSLERQKQNNEFTPAKTNGYLGERKKILIVDDEINQRLLMSDLLSPLGFDVYLAHDAKAGFVEMAQQNIDLLILDVRMPEVDGWEMVKKVREQGYAMPVLMVSANARDADYSMAADGYHNAYIAKPINIDTMTNTIGRLLNIDWNYFVQPSQSKDVLLKPSLIVKPRASKKQYRELIALAEIGYLSGFKDKLAQFEQSLAFPPDVALQIKDAVESCNFPKIIEYLEELCHAK